MSLTLIGLKKGMTRIFDTKTGKVTPCTLIEIEPNVVTQVKTKEQDGYVALQIGAGRLSTSQRRRCKKPILGHFEKKQIEPRRRLKESRLVEIKEEWKEGVEIGGEFFVEGSFVDVQGTSKGRGYQGVVKRHGQAGSAGGAHGAGPTHRHHGSSGSIRAHGRVVPGKPMAGQMGSENVTVQSLQVMAYDAELKAIAVKGAIPGPIGGVVCVRKAVKKNNAA